MIMLGLDLGDKRIGVAISDPGEIMAVPVKPIELKAAAGSKAATNEIIRAVAKVVMEQRAEKIVVGLPISMSGNVSEQTKKVKRVCEQMSKALPIPVVTWDERLSTSEADRALAEAGITSKMRRNKLDSSAAAIILQGYLDSQRKSAPPNEFKGITR